MKRLISEEKLWEWNATLADSCYSKEAFCREFNLNIHSLYKWLDGRTTPRENNMAKLEKGLAVIKDHKRLRYHPSYGYATMEQIEKLKTLGMGPDRDLLIEQIKYQQEHNGKTKR